MILGVFSVSLSVKDLNVSRDFYQKLGFQVFAGSLEKRYLIMKNESTLIGLFQGMFEGNIMTFNPGWDENANNIESFDDIRNIQASLKAAGLQLISEADTQSTGPASLMLADPDGNLILIDQHRQRKCIMKTEGNTVDEILNNVPQERREVFQTLHKVILDHLPDGFEAGISYGGLGYVVPHSIYPSGYHCKPSEPLPFAGIASQKNSINFYHMGIYAEPTLYEWFVSEYPKHSKLKLDMGKSCIRFKKIDAIPYELIGELMTKMSLNDWISLYERDLKK